MKCTDKAEQEKMGIQLKLSTIVETEKVKTI